MKHLKTYKIFESDLSQFISKVKSAKVYATEAHKGQKRRGGGDYITHPEAVAKIVHKVKRSKKIADLIAASYLHDTIEDTDVNIDDIKEKFGNIVASLVEELSSNEEELEKIGKEKYLTRKMLNMSSWGLVIKLADRLHNVKDIPEKLLGSQSDKSWARRYASQTNNIIKMLEKNRELSPTQQRLIKKIKKKIKDALE